MIETEFVESILSDSKRFEDFCDLRVCIYPFLCRDADEIQNNFSPNDVSNLVVLRRFFKKRLWHAIGGELMIEQVKE